MVVGLVGEFGRWCRKYRCARIGRRRSHRHFEVEVHGLAELRVLGDDRRVAGCPVADRRRPRRPCALLVRVAADGEIAATVEHGDIATYILVEVQILGVNV